MYASRSEHRELRTHIEVFCGLEKPEAYHIHIF
jgi:hypothetical protein